MLSPRSSPQRSHFVLSALSSERIPLRIRTFTKSPPFISVTNLTRKGAGVCVIHDDGLKSLCERFVNSLVYGFQARHTSPHAGFLNRVYSMYRFYKTFQSNFLFMGSFWKKGTYRTPTPKKTLPHADSQAFQPYTKPFTNRSPTVHPQPQASRRRCNSSHPIASSAQTPFPASCGRTSFCSSRRNRFPPQTVCMLGKILKP